VTKKDLVAAAVQDYPAARREEIHRAMGEAMRVLDLAIPPPEEFIHHYDCPAAVPLTLAEPVP
jgi:hypothetical protein